MIKWIHRNKRSLAVFLILSAIVLSMSFFGVDMATNSRRKPVIKIDETEISYEQFQKDKNRRQQNRIDQYREMLGENFNQFAKNIANIKNSQIVDAIISESLFYNEAVRLGLRTGENELKATIKRDVFGNNYNAAFYDAYLSRIGMSSRAFEDNLRKTLLIKQYQSLLQSAAEPSMSEIRSQITQDEAAYKVKFVEIDPAALLEKAVDPGDEELEKFFKAEQTNYEIPPRIEYEYVVFDPQAFEAKVEVSTEDVEFEYAENESRFTIPEEVKARHIMLSFPKGADVAKRDEVKKRAEEAHAKATAGEDFAALVSQYSDDITTSLSGGDLGTVRPNERGKEFDGAVFKIKAAGVAPLIHVDTGYQIVKVDEYVASKLRPLEEVKAEIEAEVRKREAPSYSSAAANETFARWKKGDKLIGDIAIEAKLPLNTSGGMLEKAKDPGPNVKGLTASLFEDPEQTKQLVETGAHTILAGVKKFEEAKLPPFKEVRERVLQDYKKDKAAKLARERAEEAVALFSAEPQVTLAEAAKKLDLKAPQEASLTRKSPGSGPVAQNKELVKAVFSIYKAPAKVKGFFNNQGKYVLAEVESIAYPKPEEVESKLETYTTQAKQESSGVIMEAMLNRLKKRATIEVDQMAVADPENAPS